MAGFQIKDFVSIVAGELNHARAVTDKITDFAPGSVARTIMEAPAVEIEELYLQMFLGLRDAIPVATFKSFGFDKLPARRAFGYASVSAQQPLTAAIEIPAGTKFNTDAGAQYSSTVAVTWGTGASMVRVPVQADEVGLVGNVAAGVITSCALFPSSSGFVVSNSLIDNGADVETDTEREARFADFVQALSRGTDLACIYAAKSAAVISGGTIDESVTRVGYAEIAGRVRIYLYGNRGLVSSALLADAQKRLDGWRDEATGEIHPGYRPAGVRVEALRMAERAVSFACAVRMLSGYTLSSAVRQQLSDIYNSAIRAVLPGVTLYQGSLVEALLSVPGVSAVVPLGSDENIVCDQGEALVPGAFMISQLS